MSRPAAPKPHGTTAEGAARAVRRMTRPALLLSLVLAGCATPPPPRPSYVVLLPNSDGTVGRVTVRGSAGSQVLSQPLQGTNLDGATPPYPVSPEQVQRDFGTALAARPPRPEHFLLYFESRSSSVTAESRALLPRILERARARPAADLSVIGHTDTQGRPEANTVLGLQRATAIAQQLGQLGLADATISIESHGARNQLVATPDRTSEPRNRRVEVTIR